MSLQKPSQVSTFSFLNTYETALKDYEKGRIMTARARVLAMDKSREDYPKARKLLKRKIEPARLRLLRHYTAKAVAAEKGSAWSQAMTLYAQAAELNTTPAELNRKSGEMQLKMRQVRMDTLIAQRRKEDSSLLAWLNAYETPTGVAAKDDAFASAREHLQDVIEDRASLAYRDAKRLLSKKLPELAYIKAESYIRLAPDSERGRQLMADIKEAMPKGITVSRVNRSDSKSRLAQRMRVPETVKREQVTGLMHKGDWVKAKQFALVYRREGGKDAERLLLQIQANTEREAAAHFTKGRIAFRQPSATGRRRSR